jgi:hypothetical protein
MASHTFVDLWHFKAPIEAVWTEIADPLDWPSWWPGMERVEQIAAGDEQLIGAIHRHTVKGALPYRIRFDLRTTSVQAHRRMEGEVSGDLLGRGCWTLSTDEDGTTTQVRCDWTVEPAGGWMSALAPILRPLYGWNHHVVMRRGQRGLAARLAGR